MRMRITLMMMTIVVTTCNRDALIFLDPLLLIMMMVMMTMIVTVKGVKEKKAESRKQENWGKGAEENQVLFVSVNRNKIQQRIRQKQRKQRKQRHSMPKKKDKQTNSKQIIRNKMEKSTQKTVTCHR